MALADDSKGKEAEKKERTGDEIAPVIPKRPHQSFFGYLSQFLHPGYHLRKIKEDVKASIHALQNRDLEVLKDDQESLAHAIRGRLLATYFLVGPFGILGPICGTFFQFGIGRSTPFAAVASFFITIIVGNIFSFIGFQCIWAFSSRTLYQRKPPKLYDWIQLWKDLLPLQWQGLQRWAGANVVLMPVSALALSMIDKFAPAIAHNVPIGVLTPGLEIIFVHTSLIRLMGDLFEKESHRIAANHMFAPVFEG